MFIDDVTISVRAGSGGDGAVAFHREKYVQNGGPDGGDGGDGGDLVLLADPNMHTLIDFRYRRKFAAENGENGSGQNKKGRSGRELVIKVPVGTVVRDAEDGRVLCDMHEPGQRRVLIPGGRGGWGNAHFATSTRQAPSFANPGQRREMRQIKLTLKSIADVGLVGFPNVGKSSLLAQVTAAKPKIANYHFTTLSPNLGICRQDGLDFIMADIPGLIEGASEGAGLGFRFLQHIERTRMLVHVVDVSGCEGRDPIEDFETISDELAAYGDLAERPMIVAANKMDLTDAQEHLERLRKHLEGTDILVIPISAATRSGVEDLMREVVRMLRDLPETVVFPEEEADFTQEERFEIAKEGEVYVVTGSFCERMLRSTNFSDTESVGWFHRTLRSRGVIDALRQAGASEGDTVVFGDMEFDFVD